LARLAKDLGYRIEWSDEWDMCSDCRRAVRKSGDSYHWEPYFYVTEYGDTICLDCGRDNPEEYVGTFLGNESSAMTNVDDEWIEILEDLGFERLNEDEYERGFHPGQNDDPRAIAKSLRSNGVDRFLFAIDSVGQFDTRFSVWVDREQMAVAKASLEASGTQGEVSPSEALRKGLQAASVLHAQHEGGGVNFITINEDGTANSRTLTPEEFVSGEWASKKGSE
jgi:hypothetical protein